MITLYRSGTSWVASYAEAPAEQRAVILDLFGCLDLPCAFTTTVEPAHVLAEIQRLNPDSAVAFRNDIRQERD